MGFSKNNMFSPGRQAFLLYNDLNPPFEYLSFPLPLPFFVPSLFILEILILIFCIRMECFCVTYEGKNSRTVVQTFRQEGYSVTF